jgi:hypothetical protein
MWSAFVGLSQQLFPLLRMVRKVHALTSFARVFPILVVMYGAHQSNHDHTCELRVSRDEWTDFELAGRNPNVLDLRVSRPASVSPVERTRPASVSPVERTRPASVSPVERTRPASVSTCECLASRTYSTCECLASRTYSTCECLASRTYSTCD